MNDTSPAITLAVLPFPNLSDHDDLDYFAEGFVEDLITALSRFRPLQLISSRSTRTVDAGAEDDFARANQINYLVKGTFRHQDGQVRIGVQLLRAGGGALVWAERYEAPLEAIFQIQSDVIQKLVHTLSRQIDQAILASARQKPITNLEAYACWLRGVEQLRYGTLAHDEEARRFFRRALEKDPHFARAYTGLSLSYFNEWSCQLWHKWDENEEGAFTNAERAVRLDQTDHITHLVLARILLYRRQFERAEQHIRSALDLNPNDADCLVQLATCLAYLGKPDEAEVLFLRAMRLNPFRDPWYYGYGAFVYFVKGDYARSRELAGLAPSHGLWVDFSAYMAFYSALNGQPEDARRYWQTFLLDFREKILYGRTPEPGEAIRWLIKVNPFRDTQVIPLAMEQLERAAGVRSDASSFLSPPPPELTRSPHQQVFKNENELWEMTFGGKTVRLPPLKGFHDLALLLSRPTEELHCTAFLDQPVSQVREEPALDEKAKTAYRRRMRELQEEIDEAEVMNDSARLPALREELDQLVGHLSGALDVRGKARKLGSPIERARTAVTWRIRNAIRKIEPAHPELAIHLSNSIKTGTFCSYTPEKPREWEV